MNEVYRLQRVEGTTVWGIIRNGGYHLCEFGVYEDGIISCWNKNDLWQFENELQRRWVVTSVPEEENISIFHLSCFSIAQASWLHTPQSYYKYIKDTVRSLNPKMQNIYKTSKEEIEKWEKYRMGFSASFTPFKMTSKIGYFCDDGKSCSIFLNKKDKLYITTITAYKDGTFRLGKEESQFYTLEEIEQMFDDGILTTSIKSMDWIHIKGLGKVQVKEVLYEIPLEEKKNSIRQMQKEIMDLPTAHDLCIQAYHAYLEFPCEETKEKLRETYEAVPEFERCYLGDMDTRDTDYQRILYTNELRQV